MSDISKSITALKRDKRFAQLIKKHGLPEFKWNNFERGDAFQSLCRSIIYQQISGKAAASILARFKQLFRGASFPSPEMVLKMPAEKLRGAGLSKQKVLYLKDLALKFSDGTIKHRALQKMSNEEIVEHVAQVKGIGTWTAHMFLIFTLNRPDVLPIGDLGIRKGFRILYGLKTLPDHAKMEKLAKPWRAHASAASWYLWQLADEESSEGGSSFGGKK